MSEEVVKLKRRRPGEAPAAESSRPPECEPTPPATVTNRGDLPVRLERLNEVTGQWAEVQDRETAPEPWMFLNRVEVFAAANDARPVSRADVEGGHRHAPMGIRLVLGANYVSAEMMNAERTALRDHEARLSEFREQWLAADPGFAAVKGLNARIPQARAQALEAQGAACAAQADADAADAAHDDDGDDGAAATDPELDALDRRAYEAEARLRRLVRRFERVKERHAKAIEDAEARLLVAMRAKAAELHTTALARLREISEQLVSGGTPLSRAVPLALQAQAQAGAVVSRPGVVDLQPFARVV